MVTFVMQFCAFSPLVPGKGIYVTDAGSAVTIVAVIALADLFVAVMFMLSGNDRSWPRQTGDPLAKNGL